MKPLGCNPSELKERRAQRSARSHRDGRLVNQWAADHTHAVAGATPILALDMYEHSCHMEYGAKAAAYVYAFMENIKWTNVSGLFEQRGT